MQSDEVAEPPRLWHFLISHYNEKVRWALDHKRWPHRRTALVPGFHQLPVFARTGQTKLPVLELAGELLTDSTRILEAIERVRPSPPLFPSSVAACARATELESYFDDLVAPAIRLLFWDAYLPYPARCASMATLGQSAWARAGWLACYPLFLPAFRQNIGLTPRTRQRASEQLSRYFDHLEASIGRSGYLVGDTFGIADLAVASVMAGLVRPREFPYRLPDPMPDAWLELQASVAERPGARWVHEMYARHRPPSAEIA